MEEGNAVLEGIEFLAAMIGYAGVAFIAAGCFLGLVQYCRRLLTGKVRMTEVRVTLGTYVLIGMEFLVGQDIIETVIDTNLEQLKSLAVIVVIRTVLEYFLGKEVQHLSHEAEKHGQSFQQTSVGRLLPVRRTPRVAIVMALVIAAGGVSAVHIFGSSAEEAFAQGREGEGREESEEPREGGEHGHHKRHGERGEARHARHEGRGHEGRGHEGRGHEGRGHEGRGHEGRGHEGRGHEGRRHEEGNRERGFAESEERENRHGFAARRGLEQEDAEGGHEREGGRLAREEEGRGEHGEAGGEHGGFREEGEGAEEGESERARRVRPSPKMASAMRRTAAFMRRLQRPNGSFAPSVSLEGRRRRGYNLEVQTHAIYALARYLEVVESKKGRATVLRAARAVSRRHVRTGPEGTVVVSGEPAAAGSEESLRVDDVSLVLVALLEARSVEAKVVPRSLTVDLGRLLASMQQEGGRFVYGPDDPTRSASVPGRAVYALVRLHDAEREEVWRRAALEGASYIFRQEGANCDQWILRSGAALLRMGEEDGALRVPETDIQRCAEGLARRFVARTQEVFQGRRRSCLAQPLPSTQSLEAVLAYNSADRPEGVDVFGFEGLANRSVRRLLKCQVRNGRTRGGFMGQDTRRGMRTEDIQSALATLVAYEVRRQEARGGER